MIWTLSMALASQAPTETVRVPSETHARALRTWRPVLATGIGLTIAGGITAATGGALYTLFRAGEDPGAWEGVLIGGGLHALGAGIGLLALSRHQLARAHRTDGAWVDVDAEAYRRISRISSPLIATGTVFTLVGAAGTLAGIAVLDSEKDNPGVLLIGSQVMLGGLTLAVSGMTYRKRARSALRTSAPVSALRVHPTVGGLAGTF